MPSNPDTFGIRSWSPDFHPWSQSFPSTQSYELQLPLKAETPLYPSDNGVGVHGFALCTSQKTLTTLITFHSTTDGGSHPRRQFVVFQLLEQSNTSIHFAIILYYDASLGDIIVIFFGHWSRRSIRHPVWHPLFLANLVKYVTLPVTFPQTTSFLMWPSAVTVAKKKERKDEMWASKQKKHVAHCHFWRIWLWSQVWRQKGTIFATVWGTNVPNRRVR